MDQAKGILAFIQAKHPDKNYDVDRAMSDLVRYTRKPETLSEEIVGKSIMTLLSTILFLKLPPEIQTSIRSENLPVSQEYLFAANLDCPDLRNSL